MKTAFLRLAALGVGLAWLLSAAPPAPAAGQQITMNFKDAELEAVVQFISEITGKNFILDEKVRGKITVISPSQVTVDEAYEVFQAILNVKGFTIVPSGKVLKIVATREAKQSNIETVQEEAPPGDRYVTRLLPLTFVEAEAISGILAPLVSKDSAIVAYAPTNTLIITDSYSNIDRLTEIIATLDVETEDVTLEIVQLEYAAADTIAKTLAQAVTEKSRSPRRRRAPARGQANVQVQADAVAVKIIPDGRTNTLIIIADPTTLQELKEMIAALDVEIPKGSGKINVYYLKYADAENVASVLTAISKSAGTKSKPGQPQAQQAAGKEVSVEFEEPVQITADKTTNSLVIIASPQDYEILKGVIEKLDIRRPQVLVEALIVEMNYEKFRQLGIDWRTTNNPTADGVNVVAGSSAGGISSLSGLANNPLGGPTGLFVAAIDGTITSASGAVFPNVGALIRALETQSDANILSTPHLLTTDNEEAEIVVSQNVPFQTSEKFDSNGNPIFTFEYRDVGLTLRLTPQINEDSYVKMKLFQEVSTLLSSATGSGESRPTTTKRSAKTTVVVKDDTTVVIGGLIQDNVSETLNSVPCLGDLPLLGYLFRTTEKTHNKTNLLIFLTPRIISNMADLERITEEKRSNFGRFHQPESEDEAPTEKIRTYLDNVHDRVPAEEATQPEDLLP